MHKSIIGAMCTCLAVVSFSTNSALVGRLAATEGGTDYQAYYDTDADLTWLADANYAMTSGYDDDGRMLWNDAKNWAATLNIAGTTGWRLPDTIDVGNDGPTYTNIYQGVDYGYNITTHSEMSNMFYNVLGNLADLDSSGAGTGCFEAPNHCLTSTGPFSNLQADIYWSATVSVWYDYEAWIFSMDTGNQSWLETEHSKFAWAVQSGDVGASVVPIPSAVWLFGSGLIGLIGIARRKA